MKTEKLKNLENESKEISKIFWELFENIPINKPVGLSGVCGDWPTDDSQESIIKRSQGYLIATKSYMLQTIKILKDNK